MSQADLNIDNVSRSLFRAEVNQSLQALASLNSGATEPSTTYARQLWADTTTGILKIRNATNDGWNELFELDASDLVKIGANSTITSLSGLTTPLSESQGGTGTSAGNMMFKNRIINGAMMIDQRNAGASVTITNTADRTYLLDRWAAYTSVTSKFSVQQNAGSVTLPTGFINYLGCTSLSAYSSGSTDEFFIQQRVEGFNIADLSWGTAGAKTITLSFQVYSSLTGTFSGSVANSAGNRCYVFSYTISSANTWTAISVTIPGDTTGTWLTTNGVGLRLTFNLGGGSSVLGTAGSWGSTNYDGATGSVSVVGTNGATFYITGVQLEKGSTATSFDYRPYGTELQLCQRYLPAFFGNTNTIVGQAINSTSAYYFLPFVVTPRVAPTGISTTAISGSNFILTNSTSSALNVTSISMQQASTSNILLAAGVASGLTAGNATLFVINTAAGAIFGTGCEL